MGGNAIKSARRISKPIFEQYCSELISLFPEVKLKPTLSFRNKDSFGDIDIIVETNSAVNIRTLVRDRIAPSEDFDNGPYYSFLYKDAQVDFILAPPKEFDMTCQFMNWNDIGNFFGRVARSMNFKYGHDGLSYEKHLDDHYKITVLISNDISKILPFLGYDYSKWVEGFNSEDDIFAYAASSPYFNPLYFNLLEQNHNDRVRNKKRKMYQKMLEYIEKHELKGRDKLSEEERQEHYDRAIVVFGNAFDLEVKQKMADYDKHLLFKSRFNGDIVSELTGLTGIELGKFMRSLTQKNDLKDWVLSSSKEKIEEFIKTSFINL